MLPTILKIGVVFTIEGAKNKRAGIRGEEPPQVGPRPTTILGSHLITLLSSLCVAVGSHAWNPALAAVENLFCAKIDSVAPGRSHRVFPPSRLP